MKKKTNIFGFDRTPRRMMWAEIDQLVKQIEIQKRQLATLQEKLSRYARPKDKRGRFIKIK